MNCRQTQHGFSLQQSWLEYLQLAHKPERRATVYSHFFFLQRNFFTKELVFVKVAMANGAPPLYAGAYYRSQIDNGPNTSLDSLNKALELVEAKVGNGKASIVLAGDFNCRDIDWETLSVPPGSQIPSVCKKLIDVSITSGLTQLQRESTKLDSLLDLFFSSNPSLVDTLQNAPGISTATEHESIIVHTKLRADISKTKPHKVYLWKKADWQTIKQKTAAFAEDFMEDSCNKSVDEQWKLIEEHLNTMTDKHIPSKMSRERVDQPWIFLQLI